MKCCLAIVLACAAAVPAFGVDERLAAEVNAAVRGFAAAQKAATDGDAAAAADEVKALNDRWGPFFKAYRDTATMDEKWKGDFDAVTGAIEMASAMLSRQEPLDAVAKELAAGSAILAALRDRNGIPVPQSDLQEVITALEEAQSVASEWSRPGSAPPDQLSAVLESVKSAWEAARLGSGGEEGNRFRPAGDVAQQALEQMLAESMANAQDAVNRRRALLFRAALDRCLDQARQLSALRGVAP